MTTALVPYNPAVAWFNGDRKAFDCRVTEFFGLGFENKIKPLAAQKEFIFDGGGDATGNN